MRRLTLVLLALLAALLLGAARPGLARADDDGRGGGDNAAIAINTKDDSSLFRFAWAIRRVGGEVVDQTNGAVAYASCERCQTVAIAIEIVLVTGSPSTVTPQNIAIAYNESCTLCDTMASAYQFVIGVGDGPVHFTKDGRKKLHEIRKALSRMGKEGLTTDEIRARTADLVAQIKDVLANDLVSGPPGEDEQGDVGDEQGEDSSGAPGGGRDGPRATTDAGQEEGQETPVPAETTGTTTAPADTGPAATTTAPATTAAPTTTAEPAPTTTAGGSVSTTTGTTTAPAPTTTTTPTTDTTPTATTGTTTAP